MNISVVVDIIIVGIIILFLVQGFFRGFVYEVMSLLALVVGYIAVIYFGDSLMRFLENSLNIPPIVSKIISPILLFIIGYILVKILELYMSRFIRFAMLSNLNRIAGLAMGVLKGSIILFLIVLLIRVQEIFPMLSNVLKDSQVIPYLDKLYTIVLGFLN